VPRRAVRLSPRLDQALVAVAAEQGVTISDVIREAVEAHLGRETIEAAQPDESIVELLAAIDAGYDETWVEALSG
jgi:predicted DNA-binding protein